MKKFALYLILFGLALTNCSDDDNDSINPLNDTGLLGEWEISSRGINNVSSLEALCCETIRFTDDSENNDMRGNYIFDDASGAVTNGVFVVDDDSNIILYTTNSNNSYTQEYSLNTNVLEVWYFEEGNRYWTQYNRL